MSSPQALILSAIVLLFFNGFSSEMVALEAASTLFGSVLSRIGLMDRGSGQLANDENLRPRLQLYEERSGRVLFDDASGVGEVLAELETFCLRDITGYSTNTVKRMLAVSDAQDTIRCSSHTSDAAGVALSLLTDYREIFKKRQNLASDTPMLCKILSFEYSRIVTLERLINLIAVEDSATISEDDVLAVIESIKLLSALTKLQLIAYRRVAGDFILERLVYIAYDRFDNKKTRLSLDYVYISLVRCHRAILAELAFNRFYEFVEHDARLSQEVRRGVASLKKESLSLNGLQDARKKYIHHPQYDFYLYDFYLSDMNSFAYQWCRDEELLARLSLIDPRLESYPSKESLALFKEKVIESGLEGAASLCAVVVEQCDHHKLSYGSRVKCFSKNERTAQDVTQLMAFPSPISVDIECEVKAADWRFFAKLTPKTPLNPNNTSPETKQAFFEFLQDIQMYVKKISQVTCNECTLFWQVGRGMPSVSVLLCADPQYVIQAEQQQDFCPFCEKISQEFSPDDKEVAKILFENEHSVVFRPWAHRANTYDCGSTHMLIVPKMHLENIMELRDWFEHKEMVGAMFEQMSFLSRNHDCAYIRVNNGMSVGWQSVPHMHWHFHAPEVDRYGGSLLLHLLEESSENGFLEHK